MVTRVPPSFRLLISRPRLYLSFSLLCTLYKPMPADASSLSRMVWTFPISIPGPLSVISITASLPFGTWLSQFLFSELWSEPWRTAFSTSGWMVRRQAEIQVRLKIHGYLQPVSKRASSILMYDSTSSVSSFMVTRSFWRHCGKST